MAASPSIMAAEAGAWLSRRIIIGVLSLLAIAVVTIALLLFNYYWLGLIFFFAGLFLVAGFGLEKYQFRNLVLLLIAASFVVFAVGTWINDFWLTNPEASPFPGNTLATFLTSILVGVVAAFIIIVIPFLCLVGIATVGILKWHHSGQDVSFFEAYRYLLFDLLGIFRVFINVEDGELKGDEKALRQFKTFGGPAWLTVYPGYVVVLHRWGKVTRVVGLGSTVLGRGEKIKAILPLATKGGVNVIEDVLTRDRIPLKISVVHAAQLEPAADTKKRLQEAIDKAEEQLKNATDPTEAQKLLDEAKKELKRVEEEKTFGDEYDQCCESIARLAAAKAPDIWESMKGGVASNTRDIIMSCNFDEIFTVTTGGSGLAANVQQRKIAEIEGLVSGKVKESGPGKGVALRVVDIVGVNSPKEVEDKLITEATALAHKRIKRTEAETEEDTAVINARIIEIQANAEQKAADYQAKAIQIRAKADAEAETIREKARAEAKADYYRQIIRTLRGQDLEEDTIKVIIQGLATSASLEEQWKQLVQLTVHYVKGDHTGRAISEIDQN